MRGYASVSPMFWIRGSGKRIRGEMEAQVVALYLMTCPLASMTGIFHLALPTLCHETGLSAEGALKGLRRCSSEQIAFWDEDEELVWVPALAKHQLGERMSVGKNGKPDHRVAAIKKSLAPFKGHRFHDLFLDRYASAYLLNDLVGQGASEGLSSPNAQARLILSCSCPDQISDPDPEGEHEGGGAEEPGPTESPLTTGAKQTDEHAKSETRIRVAGKRRAPETPPPEDFESLLPGLLVYAKKKNWPEWWVKNRLESFADVAVSRALRYVDWSRAAQNYMRNEQGYKRGPSELAHLAPLVNSDISPDELDAKRNAREAELKKTIRADLARKAGEVDVAGAKSAILELRR